MSARSTSTSSDDVGLAELERLGDQLINAIPGASAKQLQRVLDTLEPPKPEPKYDPKTGRIDRD
jgi:hypothetical protein